MAKVAATGADAVSKQESGGTEPARAEWGRALRADDVDFVRKYALLVSTEQLETYCQVALDRGSVGVGKYLLEETSLGTEPGVRERMLAVVAGSGVRASVDYLLALGVGNLYLDLPLVTAAMSGDVEIVKRILDAGADPNQGNPGFVNALDVALSQGFDDIAQVLRAHGAIPGRCVFPDTSTGEGAKDGERPGDLDWKEENLKPSGIHFSTEVPSGAPDIAEFVREKLSLQRRAWDVLRVEYWGEGRVVVYPGSASSDERCDDVTFDLLFADLRECEASYDAMDDESAAEQLVNEMLEALRDAFATPLAARLGVPVAFLPYGEPAENS